MRWGATHTPGGASPWLLAEVGESLETVILSSERESKRQRGPPSLHLHVSSGARRLFVFLL